LTRELALGPTEVHVWLAFQHASEHARQHDQYLKLLSPEEREQESRFHFERDRIRYRVTRAMTRGLLSRYLGIEPADCEFELNAYGRPSLANRRARSAGIEFNISHTQDLIMLGVTQRRALGVDVERVCERRASADLAARYFASAEGAHVASLPPRLQPDLFFQYWTLKESYIKARGMGLSIPLDKFAFNLREDGVDLHIDPALADDPHRWCFIRLQPTPEHRAAICAERRDGELPKVILRDAVGFMASEGLA